MLLQVCFATDEKYDPSHRRAKASARSDAVSDPARAPMLPRGRVVWGPSAHCFFLQYPGRQATLTHPPVRHHEATCQICPMCACEDRGKREAQGEGKTRHGFRARVINRRTSRPMAAALANAMPPKAGRLSRIQGPFPRRAAARVRGAVQPPCWTPPHCLHVVFLRKAPSAWSRSTDIGDHVVLLVPSKPNASG